MDTRPDDRRDSRRPERIARTRVVPASRPAAGGIRVPEDVARERAHDESREQFQAQVVVMLDRIRARAAADAIAAASSHASAIGDARVAPLRTALDTSLRTPTAEPASVESSGADDSLARAALLVDRLQIVGSAVERSAVIQSIGDANGPLVVSFVNAHAFNLAWKNAAFHRSLMDADVLLRDGVGVSKLLKLLGRRDGVNMNGTDLIPELLKLRCHDVALFGTRDPYLDGAARRLAERGVDVKVMIDGFQPDDVYLDAVHRHRPALVILAMGMPKQERLSCLLRQQVSWPCVIVNGGAILDFMSGRVRRAPRIVRAMQFEWAYRLMMEPRRLGKRYVVGNLAFIARALKLSRWLREQRAADAKTANDAAREVGATRSAGHWPR
jgi:exopolysaccharide biosynthesis WecB/TagA/CpsF family protein